MRVFVTGATGFVGSAIVQELLGAGHHVIGMVRSDASARALAATGAEVYRGDLEDLDSLRQGVAAADGVIHTGFVHDFSRFKEVCEIDRRAIEAMGSVLVGTSRPLIVTSGTALQSPGRLATEDSPSTLTSDMMPRAATEEAARALEAQGVNASVVRLSPSVHDDGDHGFVPTLIAIARDKGVSAYLEDGQNRWNAVHRRDAAKVYRLALEQGSDLRRFHAVGEEAIPFRQIAETIGKHLNLPVVSKSHDEAAAHFAWFTHFAAIDCPASSALTQKALGWQPTHKGLIADLDEGTYFYA